ncbi:hypothetical protein CAOG_009278 [Capsaspora owczarzaki ATCC 30864]|uniref:Uncharacterized protein n=1 Tax=Capsaspora owczarzaki (strain ATCC 30864) TaxID=595528 RepID=A0A0D2X052_CAPO3|nr:hypothetical protein CAOG_009278 [Capsaspora owczarzaki ATCC 30864]
MCTKPLIRVCVVSGDPPRIEEYSTYCRPLKVSPSDKIELLGRMLGRESMTFTLDVERKHPVLPGQTIEAAWQLAQQQQLPERLALLDRPVFFAVPDAKPTNEDMTLAFLEKLVESGGGRWMTDEEAQQAYQDVCDSMSGTYVFK